MDASSPRNSYGAALAVSGCVMLVAFRRIAESPIKKMIDQPIEFLMLIELDGGIRQTPLTQMVDQAVLRQNQSPEDFGQRYAFTVPFVSELVVRGLNRLIRLLPKPAAEIVIHTVCPVVQIVIGKFVI